MLMLITHVVAFALGAYVTMIVWLALREPKQTSNLNEESET